MENTKLPVRLIVCVDGTWFGPDGLSQGFAGNISNIFRIWCCTKEGATTDENGKTWQQERVYIKGVDNPSNWGAKLLSGAFGTGIEKQIKDVYRICCEKAGNEDDEIFFFGFSRAYMHIAKPTTDGQTWDELYEHMLELYPEVRSGNENRKGSIHQYMTKSKPHPKLPFIGVIDTVKAFEDADLYDISLHASLGNCRHVLALNETKSSFTPEMWFMADKSTEYLLRKASETHSVQEAWFLGSHGDLGGGNANDGAALYACQWLLSEAQDAGMQLSFVPVKYNTLMKERATVDDPLQLCFIGEPHTILSKNRIATKMWNIASIHQKKGYDVRINQRQNSWIFATSPRHVFEDGQLRGYLSEVAGGVFIHPSVYQILDTDTRVMFTVSTLDLGRSRPLSILDESQVFWQSEEIDETNETKFRILVCGDAGVGKSTLINLLLGVPNLTAESESQHGVHDIEHGISPEGAAYIVHDSCGFQTGQQDEIERVKSFLRTRATSSDFDERLHAILYCVASTRVRTTESADKDFFSTIKDCDTAVPVIVVATRLDELEALCGDQIEDDYMKEHEIRSRRHIQPSQWDEIEDSVKAVVDRKKTTLIEDLTSQQFLFSGPVFTSKRDEKTIEMVVKAITDSLSEEKLRKIFVAAQICSVQPKIDYALTRSIALYRRAVQTAVLPIAWSGLAASSTVTVLIVRDVLKAFGYTRYSSDMASQIISTMLVGNYKSSGIYIAGTTIDALSAGAIATGVGTVAGAGLWYAWKMVTIPQFGRMLLMCTVDAILIMEIVFWQCHSRKPETEDIKAACVLYQTKANLVHADVEKVLGILDTWAAFQFEKLRHDLGEIIDRYRTRKRD